MSISPKKAPGFITTWRNVQYIFLPVPPQEWPKLMKGQVLIMEVKIGDELHGPAPCVLLQNKMTYPAETGLYIQVGELKVTVLASGITQLYKGAVLNTSN